MAETVVIDALQYSNWDRARFEELRRGGLDAVHVTLVYWENARETIAIIGRWHDTFRRFSDLILPVRSAADILEARRTNRTGIIFGFQNCSPIEDDVGLVQVFHDLGVRIMQLTYNNQSLIGAGCYETEDPGISRFGRNVIREMNRAGMIVDLSHSAERTSLNAIELSQRPVIISHANPLSFRKGVRNKSDDLLKSLAASGGMLGFSLYPLHLRDGSDCTLDSFCDMVASTAELMGVERIGIGSDLCLGWDYQRLEWMRSGRWTFETDYGEGSRDKASWPAQPHWFRSPADMPALAAGLAQRGFSAPDVAGIMGGNWFRFFSEGFQPVP
ncbi:MAG TPA: membrane dipeptidase [Dongiaceae bacterium]|jgi:microsomal dipeptidase-like Zn-dependent dipeptidase